jgi:hypothetical protein
MVLEWDNLKLSTGPVSVDGRFKLVWELTQEGQPTLYTVYDGEAVLARGMALKDAKALCQAIANS